MLTPLYFQTGTLLPNGTVLIAGGSTTGNFDQTATNAAEVYTPASVGTAGFTTTGQMYAARVFHTASLLGSGPYAGQVVIIGGENYYATQLAQAELYNPGTGTFSPSPGNPQYPRSMHTATTLQDGRILIAGGVTGCVGCGESNLAVAELYQPLTGMFSSTGSLITPRTWHTATLLQNNKVLIVGGRDGNNSVTATAEIYDPVAGTFSSTGSLSIPRCQHTASILPNGMVLIAGGADNNGNPIASAEIYNPSTGTFATTGSLGTARYGASALLLSSGNVLVYGGGVNAAYTNDVATATAEIYSPSAGTFTGTSSLNDPRIFPTTTALNDGTILASGGLTGSGTVSDVEQYNINNSVVTGFVNPKFVILGITYAPPGPSSYVSYQNMSTVGNTTTLTNSNSTETNISTSLMSTLQVNGLGIIGGAVKTTVTDSTDITQGASSSTAVTVSKQITTSDKTTGTGNAFSPVNYDYDIVWLWLNPVEIFSVDPNNPGALTWNGYGFDPSDLDKMDIYPVQVGCLNGDFGPCPSVQAVLARSWANGEQIWPAGDGPGLNATDILHVLGADPFVGCEYGTNSFSNCSYSSSNFGTPRPTTSADGRFTQYGGNSPIDYIQSGPGNGAGLTQSYADSVTNTSATTNGTSYSFKQSFGIETNFMVAGQIPLNLFMSAIQSDTKFTDTLTTTYSYQQAITTSTNQTNTLSVTGPSCPQTSGPCSPAYSGPGEFLVYQDNLFGTFMFFPGN